MYQLLFQPGLPADGRRTRPPPGLRLDPARRPRPGAAHLRRRRPRARATRSCGPRCSGCDLPGPVGLAAGFDKNAVAHRRPGDARLRLRRDRHGHRRSRSRATRSRGSSGCVAGPRADQPDGLQQRRRRRGRRAARGPPRPVLHGPPLGVNLGKTKVDPEDEAVDDYLTSTERLAAPRRLPRRQRHARPTRPGCATCRPSTSCGRCSTAVREAADRTVTGRRVPLLVKIAPDLADEDIDAVADLAVELGLDGIIATNTTIARDGLGLTLRPGAGRGRPAGCPARRCRARSLEVLRRLYARVGDRITLIGVGGIEDRRGRLAAHPGRRHPGPGLHRLHLPGPVLVPRGPQGPRRPAGHQPVRHPRRRGRRRHPEGRPHDRRHDRSPSAPGCATPWTPAARSASASTRTPRCWPPGGWTTTSPGLERFARTVVEALADRVAVLKPQSAFFERFGSRGIAVLERAVERGPRGRRAGAAGRQARRHRLDDGRVRRRLPRPGRRRSSRTRSPSAPYLGFGSLRPALDAAADTGAGVFVLALTSNPEGAEVQHAARGRRPVAWPQLMLDHIAAENAGAAPLGLGRRRRRRDPRRGRACDLGDQRPAARARPRRPGRDARRPAAASSARAVGNVRAERQPGRAAARPGRRRPARRPRSRLAATEVRRAAEAVG